MLLRQQTTPTAENPPILHRKELLLPPDDPRLPKFKALTAAAEEHGLFAESNKIGTRDAWNKRIEAAGLVLTNGRLLRADEEHLETERHRTAIARRDLSQPMQLLMRLGVVASGRSVFDYGCGRAPTSTRWRRKDWRHSVGIPIMRLRVHEGRQTL